MLSLSSFSGSRLPALLFSLGFWIWVCAAASSAGAGTVEGGVDVGKKRSSTGSGGYDIPIQVTRRRRDHGGKDRRGDVSGTTGLGDNADLLYAVPIELGNSVAAVNLDTGSSDLWVVSSACQSGTCANSNVPRYPISSLKSPQKIPVNLVYGDSTTGTFANGLVGRDTATIAGLAMTDQVFGVINDTNNPLVQFQMAGIFGLGFPSESYVQEAAVMADNAAATTDDFLHATYQDGPLLTRLSTSGALQIPQFSITLARNTIDISGTGMLTIGKLPDGIDNSSLTWVPVRLYKPEDGGLMPPGFAPNEVYPFRWEVDIEGVFLDGQRVPDSTIKPNGVNPGGVTALIDTGNSLLRGPSDVVNSILQTVSPSYNPSSSPNPTLPCAVPHTVAFQIGGKLFPVDPRDFITPSMPGDATTCIADSIVTTDPPSYGALFSWSLGDPFMKSNLVAFHYGNITHPSVDPPRIGFLSLVPSNAGDLLQQAVGNAQKNGGNFAETLIVAPTASAATASQITISPGTTASSQPGLSSRVITVTMPAQTSPSATGSPVDNGARGGFGSEGGVWWIGTTVVAGVGWWIMGGVV